MFHFSSLFPIFIEKFLKCKICFQVHKDLNAFNTHRALHKKVDEPAYNFRAQNEFGDDELSINPRTQSLISDNGIPSSGETTKSISLNKLIAGAKCRICGVVKRTSDLLAQHINIYHRKQYFCEFCATICVGSDSLDSHRYQAHHIKKVRDVYSCGLCNESFLHSDDINQHMSVHSSGELRNCTIYLDF